MLNNIIQILNPVIICGLGVTNYAYLLVFIIPILIIINLKYTL